jgi:serine/threonine protein kinase
MQYCNTGSLHQYIVGGAAMTREDLKAQIRRRSKGHKDLVKISRQSRRNLSLEEVYSIFKDIVSGLAYLHSSNYIHRELNPSNCLLHRDGSKITGFISDYGEIKTPVNSRQSIYDTSTLVYSAPETLRKDESGQYGDFTTKSDVFSLGMILYFMCFSNLPYENANIENEELEDVELLCEEISHWQGFQYGDIHRQHPDLPPKLILLMEKLLSLNPTERPNTQEILGVLLS